MTTRPIAEGLAFDRLLPVDQTLAVEVMTDPDVRRFLGGPKPSGALAPAFAGWRKESDEGRLWCLRFPGQAEGLGLLFLDRHAETGLPEVSFLFPRRNWGMGLASRSIKALAEWALPRDGAICAETQSANSAARRALERAGFAWSREYLRFGVMQSFYVAAPATGENA